MIDRFLNFMQRKKAERLLNEGVYYFTNGRYEKAIKNYTKAIEIVPTYLDAYGNRGLTYFYAGDIDQAMSDYEFVLERQPRSIVYYNRSLAYAEMGEADKAISDLSTAIELAPDVPDYYNNRSVIYALDKKYDLAIPDAIRTIELGDPKSGYTNLAIIHEKMENYQDAIQHWTEVLNIDEKDAVARCSRGTLYATVGNVQEAIVDLTTGLKKKKHLSESLQLQAEQLLQELQLSIKK
jgi:tetratricopeptide (TPR) repeat protein